VFGSEILEVAIGMGALYLVLSLVCSAITEAVARAFAMCSSTLKSGVENLLSDPNGKGLAETFYAHPLVKGLYRQGWFDRKVGRGGKPSYISPRVFRLALLDTLPSANSTLDGNAVSKLRSRVANIEDDGLKKALLVCLYDANEIGEAQANVERWFREAMERVSGWYRRKMQLIILGVAAAMSIALNVDSFDVANSLWNDAALRDSVVAASQKDTGQALSKDLAIVENQLGKLGLPLGWRSLPVGLVAWASKIAGLLFTTIALSLGAPFWFDLLSRFVGVASVGQEPDMPAAEARPKS
jgi:hypothetical protein